MSLPQVIAMRRVWEEVDMKRYRGMLSGSFIRYVVFVRPPPLAPLPPAPRAPAPLPLGACLSFLSSN